MSLRLPGHRSPGSQRRTGSHAQGIRRAGSRLGAVCVVVILMASCSDPNFLSTTTATQDSGSSVATTTTTTKAVGFGLELQPQQVKDQLGYVYEISVKFPSGSVSMDIANSRPGKAKLKFAGDVQLVITNVTPGRNAPPTRETLNVDFYWPSSFVELVTPGQCERRMLNGSRVCAGSSVGFFTELRYQEAQLAPRQSKVVKPDSRLGNFTEETVVQAEVTALNSGQKPSFFALVVNSGSLFDNRSCTLG